MAAAFSGNTTAVYAGGTDLTDLTGAIKNVAITMSTTTDAFSDATTSMFRFTDETSRCRICGEVIRSLEWHGQDDQMHGPDGVLDMIVGNYHFDCAADEEERNAA